MMNDIKTDIRFYSFLKFEVVFRSISVIDILKNTLHMIAFSSSMENLLFVGTI